MTPPAPEGAWRCSPLTPADWPTFTELRLQLLEETSGTPLPPAERDTLRQHTLAFLQAHAQAPEWLHLCAHSPQGELVAIGSLVFWARPPYPGNLSGWDAYFLNMYTRPAWRGRGAARALFSAVMAAAQARGVPKVVLHATPAGRALYQQFGFEASSAYMERWQPLPGA